MSIIMKLIESSVFMYILQPHSIPSGDAPQIHSSSVCAIMCCVVLAIVGAFKCFCFLAAAKHIAIQIHQIDWQRRVHRTPRASFN